MSAHGADLLISSGRSVGVGKDLTLGGDVAVTASVGKDYM